MQTPVEENGKMEGYHLLVELHNRHETTFAQVSCLAIPSATPTRFVDGEQSNYT